MPTSYEDARARLVDRWGAASKHTTADVLTLGQLTQAAIRARLRGVADPGARKAARADAVKDLRAALTDAGCDRAAELQRWVAVWAVADVFGMESAKGLPLATLRAFVPLVRRNAKTETWAARLTFRDFAREAWATAATVPAREVAAAIRARLGATRKPRTEKPGAALTKIGKAIDALPIDAQRQLFAALQRRFNPSPAATAPAQAQQATPRHAQAAPTVPMVPHVAQAVPARIDAPAVARTVPPPETEKPAASIFGSWGRKAS